MKKEEKEKKEKGRVKSWQMHTIDRARAGGRALNDKQDSKVKKKKKES